MFLSLSSSSSSFVSSSSFISLGATFVAVVFFVDAQKSELSTSNVISPLARPSLENSSKHSSHVPRKNSSCRLVSSRATHTRRGGDLEYTAATSSNVFTNLCGDTKNTNKLVSDVKLSKTFTRSFFFAGRNPQNLYPSSHLNPLPMTAVVTALAPGIGTTTLFLSPPLAFAFVASKTKSTKSCPGSDTTGAPASDTNAITSSSSFLTIRSLNVSLCS